MDSVNVYVQPRASKTEVAGPHGDAIKIRLQAPPVDGRANAELVRFLAKRLNVPRSSIHIARGVTGRRKVVVLDTLEPETAWKRLLADKGFR